MPSSTVPVAPVPVKTAYAERRAVRRAAEPGPTSVSAGAPGWARGGLVGLLIVGSTRRPGARAGAPGPEAVLTQRRGVGDPRQPMARALDRDAAHARRLRAAVGATAHRLGQHHPVAVAQVDVLVCERGEALDIPLAHIDSIGAQVLRARSM